MHSVTPCVLLTLFVQNIVQKYVAGNGELYAAKPLKRASRPSLIDDATKTITECAKWDVPVD